MKYLEVPKYKIRPSPGRFLLDRSLVLSGLGILLYVAIYANYFIVNTKIPELLNWMFILGILLLMIMELVLCTVKYGNYSYEFFDKKLVLSCGKNRTVRYSDIDDIRYSTNLLDKPFRTGSIILEMHDGKRLPMKHLSNPNQAFLLVQGHLRHR